MLEIVFDRLVRLLTTSLRNFFSDNVEVSLSDITSVRFGDYINSIPLPTILAVFKAEEWDNFGLITVDSTLAYSVIDVLLGGRRATATAARRAGPTRPSRPAWSGACSTSCWATREHAFRPLSPVHFNVDRIETNPRFASISRPANAAILIELRIDMEGRGGAVEILLPYATIEPIRELLLQSFMGEKFGRDPIWEDHLATEIWQAKSDIDAILYETQLPLRRMMELKVGDTLMFDLGPDAPVRLKCGDVFITEGRMGRVGEKIAIRVLRQLRSRRRPSPPMRQRRRTEGQVMIGLLIELLVCVLLATTIGYCIVLDRRLRRLKADEATMRRTIIDLMTATENADRAVAGLRAVVEECDRTIGAQLRDRRAALRRARRAASSPATT